MALSAYADEEAERITVAERLCYYDNCIYYDLLSDEKIVKISSDGVTIEKESAVPIYFMRSSQLQAQTTPTLSAKPQAAIDILNDIFNMNREQMLLAISYIVSAFFRDISHPILTVTGERGSGKSTMLRLMSQIINPQMSSLFSLSDKTEDTAATLEKNIFVPFDNVSRIDRKTSDLLCQAVTGGYISKRKLYTDNEEHLVNLRSTFALNGIGIVSPYSDLADRMLLITLGRIPKEKRKTDSEIAQLFNTRKSELFGAICNTVSAVLRNLPNTKLTGLPRMAEFAKIGYCACNAIDDSYGELFLKKYESEHSESIKSTISSDPIISAIRDISSSGFWKGTPTQLSEWINETNGTSISPNLLSRFIKSHESDLCEIGIIATIGRGGQRYIEFNTNNDTGLSIAFDEDITTKGEMI